MSNIDVIFTNPGANTAHQMNVSWHSVADEATFVYADNKNMSNTTKLIVHGQKNETKFVGIENFYEFKLSLNNLKENTTYYYQIIISINNEISKSEIHHFKTANNNGDFYFCFLSDIHTNANTPFVMDTAVTTLKFAEEKCPNLDFILFGGDFVKFGERYLDWTFWNQTYLTLNYMIAPTVGNKEYYNINKIRTSNQWYKSIMSLPNNGMPELNSNYWFIHNKVLFISLDSNASEVYDNIDITSLQKSWLEESIIKNKGLYSYIIIFNHYPYFRIKTNEPYSYCDYGLYTWHDIYDKYGVDFALSADDHCYVRSKRLYKNHPSKNSSYGTVYITAPEIYKLSEIAKNHCNSNPLIAKVDHNGNTNGGCYFHVTNEGIYFYQYGLNGIITDKVFVKRKNRK